MKKQGIFFILPLRLMRKVLCHMALRTYGCGAAKKGNLGCRERKYKQLPPEEKESFRWNESIDKTVEALGTNVRVTMLSDRESDVFDVLRWGNDNGNTVRLIVRSNQNRRLKGSDIKLHDFMKSLAPEDIYPLLLPPSHGRKGRTAKMEVRYARVCIAPPADAR